MKLCGLTVEIPRCQALPQQLDTVHFCLNAASLVVSAPSSPDGSPETVRGPQGFIPGEVVLHGFAFFSLDFDPGAVDQKGQRFI